MRDRRIQVKEILLDIMVFIIASFCIGISTACFAAPNKIAPGGVTGISTVCNYLFGWSIGSLNLIFNIPLFIWAMAEYWGKWKVFLKFMSKTFVATIFTSIAIKIMEDAVEYFGNRGINLVYSRDIMIATIISGVLTGTGLALVLTRNGTTGGTDLIAKLTSLHFKHISIGKLLLGIDLLVVIFSAIAYKEISSPVYSGVVIFVTTKIIDTVLYGVSSANGKLMVIVSNNTQEISDKIISELHRGVTFIKSRGGYSKKEGEIILCAARRNEIHRVYEIIHQIDKDAFVIVGEAGEITGTGFGEL